MSFTFSDHRRSFSWLRDLLLLTLACAVLFGFMLGGRALSVPDEARYSEIPREMVASGDYLTPRLNGEKYFEKPVLFYWLQSASIRLFGLSEWAMRLWPAVFALLGCIAVYIAGRILFDRRTGLISGAVLASSMLYYVMSRVITLDMAVAVFLSAGLFSFLIGTRQPLGRRRRLCMALFFICAAAATMTKGLIGIVLPGLVIGVWIALLGNWRVLKTMYLLSGVSLFFLLAAPWHILVARANPEFLQFYFIHEHFARFLTTVHHRYQPFWFFIPVLLVGLFPWSAFLFQALKYNLTFSWKERRGHAEVLFLALWAALIFLFFSASHSKLVPYILPVFPPLALLIGRYLSAVWDRRGDTGVHAGYWNVLVFGLGLTAAFYAVPYFRPASDLAGLKNQMSLLAVILAAGVLAHFFIGRRYGARAGMISLTVGFVLFLMALNMSLPYLDNRSVKGLALTLKTMLKPADEVASYRTYYQDLPFYLRCRIIVVDWRGELEFGMQAEDSSDWMMDDGAFWKRWDGEKTIYMMTSRLTYNRLREAGRRVYLVAEDDNNVLLRNKKDRS